MNGMSPTRSALLDPAPHRPAVVEHLLHGHRHGGIIAQHHIAQGVAHQHHIDAAGIDQPGDADIIGGQAR